MNIPPVIRQLMIVASPQMAAFSVGGAVTNPTLLMEQFRTNGTSTPLDVSTKSWIGSLYGFAGIPAILMPFITQKIGRKWGYIITCLCMMLGWILTYRATTITELFISESVHGLGTNCLLPICFMAMTEMLDPKHRHILVQTYGIAQGLGMTVSGILGRYLHYKTISLIMLGPAVAAVAIAFMWTESPSWFACKGQFDKCEHAFVQLRGTDDLSKKELQELIIAQRENLRSTRGREANTLNTFCRKISERDFYLPCFHIFLIFMLMYWSGVDVVYVYFIEIVTKSSNNDDAAFYASITMYSIVLGGGLVQNILVLIYRKKAIIVFSTCCVIISSLTCCLISGLQDLGLLPENSLLLMYSLIGYVICASLGLNGVVFNMAASLMPVKHRNIGGALHIIFNCVLYATSLKLSSYISLYLGLWSTFLIYAINASVCIWLIWKYVPETEGKSLQEIEDYYKFGHFTESRVSDNDVDNLNVTETLMAPAVR